MKKRKISYRLVTLFLAIMLLFGCSNNSNDEMDVTSKTALNSESSGITTNNEDSMTVTSDMITYDDDDFYSDWKNENPNYIELKETTATLNGSGAVIDGGDISITKSGIYVISGKLDDGQIIVDVEDKGTVKLVLNGMEINSFDSAPIYVINCEKIILTLEEGTQNYITDGETYVFSDDETDGPSAAIFSKEDLTINGAGTLTVKANYNDGITSKDNLKITGGNIYVYSADDGLVGRDEVIVKEGNITIEAGGDGIKSTNDEESEKGFIAIEDGAFNITSDADGIQAETSILIIDGAFNVTTGGGSINGTNKGENQWNGRDKGAASESAEADTASGKAIKATSDITINGGTFSIDSSDDAIHSNNTVNISGGDIEISSGDDGIHGDSTIRISGGLINIAKSYEGIESTIISISDGEIYVVASDDGINVAGGNDESAINGRPGENSFSSSGDNKLVISGGYISVNAYGDGLDANGSIYMANGTVIVNGPTNNGNGSLDYDGTFEMDGGLLIATGSSGMAQAPSEASAQYSILMKYSSVQQAGTLIHLEDNSGNTVVTFAPKKEFQSIVISLPKLIEGTKYTLYTGGTATGSVKEGLYTDEAFESGTATVEFTISDIVTWLSETGITSADEFIHGQPGKLGRGNRQ